MEKIKVKKDVKDERGWTIPKGTVLYIIKELRNPVTKIDMLVVYVDNGTGIKDLMPKTLVRKHKVIEGR
jgi:CxxC motif-containing protein